MSAVPPPEIASSDPCPDCGYDRRALETGRPCPECGYEQPADEFVFWGNSRNDTRGGLKPLWPLFVGLPTMFALSKTLPRTVFEGWAFPILAVVVAGLIAAAQRLQFRPAGAGGPEQLRLSPRGYAVRTGCGPAEFKAWHRHDRVLLRETARGRLLVVVERPLVGMVMMDRPLVFRPSPGQATLVAGRINALLRDA